MLATAVGQCPWFKRSWSQRSCARGPACLVPGGDRRLGRYCVQRSEVISLACADSNTVLSNQCGHGLATAWRMRSDRSDIGAPCKHGCQGWVKRKTSNVRGESTVAPGRIRPGQQRYANACWRIYPLDPAPALHHRELNDIFSQYRPNRGGLQWYIDELVGLPDLDLRCTVGQVFKRGKAFDAGFGGPR